RRRKYCNDCLPNAKVDETKVTIGNLHESRKYQRSSRIRQFARARYLRSDLPKRCIICGYDKHFEVCHKKPINSFSSNTLLSEVNSLDNLIALCPNHHWEFDKGLLVLT